MLIGVLTFINPIINSILIWAYPHKNGGDRIYPTLTALNLHHPRFMNGILLLQTNWYKKLLNNKDDSVFQPVWSQDWITPRVLFGHVTSLCLLYLLLGILAGFLWVTICPAGRQSCPPFYFLYSSTRPHEELKSLVQKWCKWRLMKFSTLTRLSLLSLHNFWEILREFRISCKVTLFLY